MPHDPQHAEDATWTRAVRRHVHAPTHDWFAACAPGLEAMLADEARVAGLADVRTSPGGVSFRGRLADGYAANLRLRLANRVVVRVGEFPARAPEDVVRHVREVPWEAWLAVDVPLRVDVSVHGSRMASSGLLATKALDGIRDRMHAAGAPMPPTVASDSRADDPAVPDRTSVDPASPLPQRLMMRLERNRLTLSLDSSGEHLHRRGYRVAVTPAPIRETLAAAILRFARYDGTEPLVDPMCGSGTFPIEAALFARGAAPGAARTFAFQRWPSYRPATWDYLARKAREAEHPPAAPILGSDRDARALEAARANAVRAGVDTHVTFALQDFDTLDPRALPALATGTGSPGLIVMNPPYGLRLDSDTAPRRLFGDVGRRLAAAWRGWQYAIVLPSPDLAPVLALPIRADLRLPHGGLTVTVLTGRVP